MATYTPIVTPRLRMMRNSPVYDRSGQTASTSEPGPSRLPEFSQLVDVNLNDMAMSDTTDQPTGSRISTPSTVTRGETPAQVLRALLSRLPAESTSPVRSLSPNQQYPSERESDYDVSELANATASRAHESLKNLFSNARRDPDTPRKSTPKRNSADASDSGPSPRFYKDSSVSKGKQRSLSDDEFDQRSQSSQRNKMATRSKVSPQPVTKEFLRERFSDSFVSTEVGRQRKSFNHHSGNQTVLRDLNSSTDSPPMATSTPQQSLRMSVNSQFHTNLLESDTEMQDAIDGLNVYDDISAERSISPPPTIRKGPKPSSEKRSSSHVRRQSGSEYDLHRTPFRSNSRSRYALDEQKEVDEVEISLKSDIDWDKSRNERERHPYDHADEQEELDEVEDSLKADLDWDKSRSRRERQSFYDQEEIDEVEVSLKTDVDWDKSRSRRERQNSYGHSDSHQHLTASLSSMELTSPLGEAAVITHKSRTMHSIDMVVDEDSRQNDTYAEGHERSTNSSRSRQHPASVSRARSPSQSSAMSLDEPPVESKREQDRKWDSPHPWYQSNSDRQSSLTPRPLSPASRRKLDSFETPYQPKDENQKSHRKRSPVSSQNMKNTPHSSSPLHPQELTRASSRTSSLQTIENTYMHEDPNLRRPSRSSSPLPPAPKKRSASPSVSSVSRKQKTSSTTPSTRNQSASPSLMNLMDTPSRFISTPSRHNSVQDSSTKLTSTPRSEQNSQSIGSQNQSESPMEKRGYGQDAETDDLRDTDFSSRGGTPVPRPISPSDLSEDQGQDSEHVSWSSAKQTPSRFSIPSSTPRIIVQHTPPQGPSLELAASPSTPPRRPSSRNSRHDFKTPSPPKTPPDLPTPSSSDEADHNPPQNHATTSRVENTPQNSTWLRTPRPPGAWAQTPKPSQKPESDSESDDRSSVVGKGKSKKDDDNCPAYPRTPMNRNDRPSGNVLDTVGKTLMPPGGWLATPAPISSTVTAEARIATGGISEQNAGLLTPITSLSKGSSFDPKTPAFPGGWMATPAARKSILKVRFDSQNQINESSTQNVFDTTVETEYNTPSGSVATPSRGEEPSLPPSPRSPRKSKGPNIRVVDAFGREQDTVEIENDKRSRSMLRVVDALGREVEQTEQSTAEDPTVDIKYSSRGELLKHIRRGLNDLAEDFDDQAKDDAKADASRARIEELKNMSKQACKARDRLHSQNAKSGSRVKLAIEQQFSKSSDTASWRSRPRFWFTLLLINLILLVFMFRISVHWANQRYLNSYYDPFNPELYLSVSKSDYSLNLWDGDLSRTLWASYARTAFGGGRKTWYDWLRVTREIQSYLWNIWTNDSAESPPRNGSTWLPT